MSSTLEPIELSAYSPMWPAVYDMERERLAGLFGAEVSIEHIGSTSVPGLGAKPIIDVLLGAPSLQVIEARMAQLAKVGYRYVPEFEKAIPERRYFDKPHGQPGHFHLHAVVKDSPFWRDHLAFRDALRNNITLADEYWKLKRKLVGRFPYDRGAYADAKTAFIRTVVDKTR